MVRTFLFNENFIHTTNTSIGVLWNFSWGKGSFSGIWWSFPFRVRCFWRYKMASYSCFQTNILAKFVDIICTFFYTHSPYFMCHCTEYKLSAFQAGNRKTMHLTLRNSSPKVQNIRLRVKREEWKKNKLITTSEQFTTAKSGCANVSSNTSTRA